MRFLKFFSVALCFALLLNSCKKDKDVFGNPSHGSLLDSSGNCIPKNVHGTYGNSVTLTSANYIDVHVMLDSVGTYDIRTDTVNGYSFRGDGTLGKKGDNLVRLYGSGRPLSGGDNTFTVSYSGTFCTVDIHVEGSVVPPAAFTLDNAAGVCSGALVNGTYSTGIALGADNTATLSVNVTTIGTYSISTNTVNGITFSKSGTFTTTGAQTIILTASGIPTAATANNYTATIGASTCTFSVTAITISTATFTLGGAGSTCTGALAGGTYTAGTALGASNTLSVQVNVTTPGSYTISSNSVDGITFSKTGVFAATGTQTVILTGTGIPAAAGGFNYTITAGGGNCTASVTVVGGGSGGPAVFTLGGAAGTCTGASVAGTFTAGTALTGSNTLSVQANVTTVGTYTISTNTVNGISFSKTGTFTATGAQMVVLTGTGTPTAAGANNYTVTAGSGSCTFSITALPGSTSTSSNAVSFKVDGVTKTYNVDGGALLSDSAGIYSLELGAYVSATSDESFYLYIEKGSAITTGTYSVNTISATDYVEGGYTDSGLTSYYAYTDGSTQTGPLTIVITSITATRVQGTFQGTFKDNDGAGPGLKTITLGTFDFDIL